MSQHENSVVYFTSVVVSVKGAMVSQDSTMVLPEFTPWYSYDGTKVTIHDYSGSL